MNIKEIGNNVKLYRIRKGISQSTLAKKVYVTQQYISRIENGEACPSLEVLETISSVLNVSLLDLCCDERCYDVNIDFTEHYRARMEEEDNQVREVMEQALKSCANKMVVILRLSKSEFEVYNSLPIAKSHPVRFWSILDENGVQFALDTPGNYVWCLNKLKEFDGDKKRVCRVFVKKMIETYGTSITMGLPHNINSPWLCPDDRFEYLSLVFGVEFRVVPKNESH